MLSKAPCSVKGEPMGEAARITTDKTIANLEAEVGELRAEKAAIDQCLQRANGQLLEAAEEKSRLEDKLYATGREVNHLAQKLESLTKGKIQEEESMKNNLRKENEFLEKRNKELLNEIAKLQSNLRETEAEFEGKSEECLQRMSQLEEDNKKIEDKFTCMQREDANKLIKCHQSIEKLSTHNEELKGRLSELQSKEKSLNNMVTVLKEEVEKLMKENEHLLHKINQVDNEKTSKIHEAMHHLTGENENLLGKIRELENELDNCFTANNAAQEKINQLENENTELMNLKKELIKGLKAQGDAETNSKQDKLKENMQQSDDLSQEATGCDDDRKVMLTTKTMCEVKQSKNAVEQNVQLNDVLTETSTVKITGRSNNGKTLASKENAEYENPFNEETQTIIEACLEEPEMEGVSPLEKLQSGYHTLKRKSPDAEKSGSAIKAQLTSVEGKNSLGKLLEEAEVELKSKQEELDKTKAESVPVQSIDQKVDLSSANVITLQQQFLPLNSQLKDQMSLERKLQELQCKLEVLQNQLDMKSKAEMDLRMENYCMKGQLDALEEHSKDTGNLRTKYSEMKSERDVFERLQRENAEGKLLIAPLKAKLSCLIQKCLCRNSLIIELVRELYQHGIPDAGLVEEAEDMLNDTAILEYTHTFLSSHCQQGNMNNNTIPAGIPKQNQGLSPCFPRCLSHGSQGFADFKTPLTHRSCVAIADYRPNPNMPHTVLPVLKLSAGDVVHVTEKADSHGMYPAKVNGRLGLVPVALVEDIDELHHLCITHSDTPPCPRMRGPVRTEEVKQQLQHTHSNNCQVVSTDTSHGPMTTPYVSHKVASQPRYSRLHNKLEHSNFKAQMQATEKGKEQLCLSKFAEQFYCNSENCCETPYNQACNDTSDLKSTMSSGEGDMHLGMSASSNLSDRFVLNVKGHSKKHPSGGWRPSKMEQEPPAPVDSVRITDTVGQNGLVIDWEKPSMDETGCSNGTFVQCYRIFIDGEFHMSVTGSVCTKVVLEGLDLSVPFQVSVQTVGDNGLVSRKVNAHFLNCWPHKMLSAQPHPTLSSQTSQRSKRPEETRFTFLPTQSTWRMFIAVHDYNPLQDSPNIHPSHELAFKEGDIIWVHGKQRRDGFCEAEVNGRHGLVPICFLEDTSIGMPKSVKQKALWSVSLSPGYNRMPKVSSSSEHLHKKSSNR